jgi:hypothetical protein
MRFMLQRPCHTVHPWRGKDLGAPEALSHRKFELRWSRQAPARTYSVQAKAAASLAINEERHMA